LHHSSAPFYHAANLYVVVVLLAVLSWVTWPDALRRSAFWLCVVVVVVHSCAICLRMYIQGRPPVNNLYSSAVFIGWGCVVLSLGVEQLLANGIGVAVAGVLGFATMIIAHHLGGSGDTLEVMQAVLDTNFWLATHVTTVTLGYTATLVAGFFAIALNFRMQASTIHHIYQDRKPLTARRTAVCFATLVSFVGTVLGGIWADQSWGRFWGWDPKENGALLIVVMNALILHARWAGMIKERGLAALALVGNMVTVWSWFGTNQVGVGLHAYGFNKALAEACILFWVSNLVLLALGLVGTASGIHKRYPGFGVANQSQHPERQ
jgi:ABC-type transport system involved in cytochrome c biogenesis permease subunit